MTRKKESEILRLADFTINELKSAGFKLQRLDAITTNSVYIKLDYGTCHSIRISDHPGKKHLNYRYNLMTTYQKDRREVCDKGWPRFYYAARHVTKMIEDIKKAKQTMIDTQGLKMYETKMRMNKAEGDRETTGFWSKCEEV